jgi:hypothetical protein
VEASVLIAGRSSVHLVAQLASALAWPLKLLEGKQQLQLQLQAEAEVRGAGAGASSCSQLAVRALLCASEGRDLVGLLPVQLLQDPAALASASAAERLSAESQLHCHALQAWTVLRGQEGRLEQGHASGRLSLLLPRLLPPPPPAAAAAAQGSSLAADISGLLPFLHFFQQAFGAASVAAASAGAAAASPAAAFAQMASLSDEFCSWKDFLEAAEQQLPSAAQELCSRASELLSLALKEAAAASAQKDRLQAVRAKLAAAKERMGKLHVALGLIRDETPSNSRREAELCVFQDLELWRSKYSSIAESLQVLSDSTERIKGELDSLTASSESRGGAQGLPQVLSEVQRLVFLASQTHR